jgi:hypothetical protein
MNIEKFKSFYDEIGIIYQLDRNYNLISTFLSLKQAEIFGYSKKEITAAILNHELTKDGFYYINAPTNNIGEINPDYTKQNILQINKLGLIDTIYENIKDATIDFGDKIYSCIKHVRSSAYGFYWTKPLPKDQTAVYDEAKINRFIKHIENNESVIYETIEQASEDTLLSEDEIYDMIFTPSEYGMGEWSYIRTTFNYEDACLNGLAKIEKENSHNQFFPLENPECLVGNFKYKRNCFAINSLSDVLMITNDENNKIVDSFDNVHQAEVETGIKNIWPCVKKKKGSKTSGGFKWMYRKDYNELMKKLENELL